MDHRVALKNGTRLDFSNTQGECLSFYIESEISRGGSSILYEAIRYSINNVKLRYRIKEFYPFRMAIVRDNNQTLIVATTDQTVFLQEKRKVKQDFTLTNALFYSGSNYAHLVYQLDLFETNNTLYTVCSYSSEKTLASYHPQTLKECIHLTILCAYALSRIHAHGYLYLDLKPDNILLVEGFDTQILLCDFDSLMPINSKRRSKDNPSDFRFAYTKGFAPVEQETGQIDRLGVHSDVFSVGALLFYLLFRRTPLAFECQMDSIFDRDAILYPLDYCDDRFYDALTDFFHHTIAAYFADRYSSTEDVLRELNHLEKYADPQIPRVFSTNIVEPRYVFGRQNELDQLHKLLNQTNTHGVCVSGMGGIGKSTLVRYYLTKHRSDFDCILYLHYRGSIDKTIADGTQISINGIDGYDALDDSGTALTRKKTLLRKLLADQRALIVIDDFDGSLNELDWLIHTNIQLILISRKNIESNAFIRLPILPIDDLRSLRAVFEANLGKPIQSDEIEDFTRIVCQCQSHTLLIELIAKLIANAHISVHEAAESIGRSSLSEIAAEKVTYEKDEQIMRVKIAEILDTLFQFLNLTQKQRAVLATVCSVCQMGIDIRDVQAINQLETKDDINDLILDGWLEIDEDMVQMHRLIQEAMLRQMNQLCHCVSEKVYHYFANELSRFRSSPLKQDAEQSLSPVDQYRIQTFGKEKLKQYLIETVLGILDRLRRYGLTISDDNYFNLIYQVLMVLPQDRIDSILELGQFAISHFQPSTAMDYRCLMEIYRLMVLTKLDLDSNNEAVEWLNQAKHVSQQSNDCFCVALYWDIYGHYQDALLNGHYDTQTAQEHQILLKLIQAINHVRQLTRSYISTDRLCLYINNTLSQITIMMRSGDMDEYVLKDLINECQQLIDIYLQPDCYEAMHFLLVCGWYQALIDRDPLRTRQCIDKAAKVGKAILECDRAYIDTIMIPSANMLMEANDADGALQWLMEALNRALSYRNNLSFFLLAQQLRDYSLQVMEYCTDRLKVFTQLKQRIDAYNRCTEDPNFKIDLIDTLRKP